METKELVLNQNIWKSEKDFLKSERANMEAKEYRTLEAIKREEAEIEDLKNEIKEREAEVKRLRGNIKIDKRYLKELKNNSDLLKKEFEKDTNDKIAWAYEHKSEYKDLKITIKTYEEAKKEEEEFFKRAF